MVLIVCMYVCPLFLLQLYDDECMLLRFLILIHSLVGGATQRPHATTSAHA